MAELLGLFDDLMYQEGSYPTSKYWKLATDNNAKFDFWLMFTCRVFLSPGRCQSRLCSLNKFSSLFSLLSFLMFANTIVDNNPTYSEPDFSLTKSALAIVEEESRNLR